MKPNKRHKLTNKKILRSQFEREYETTTTTNAANDGTNGSDIEYTQKGLHKIREEILNSI